MLLPRGISSVASIVQQPFLPKATLWKTGDEAIGG
jgi:hypothetical protein